LPQESETRNASADPIEVGRVVSRRYTFTVENIKAYAEMAGDTNRLHHDLAYAESSRFGALIASAAHSTGVLFSVAADKFAPNGEAVGLGFSLTLRRAVRAGTETDLIWRISGRQWCGKLNGTVIEMSGEIRDIQSSQSLLLAEGRMLMLNGQDLPPRLATPPSEESGP